MKKMLKLIIPLILFTSMFINAQGSVVTNFDTTGWDAPASYTDWYNLRIFTLLSSPGGGYNLNMREVDSLMYELVVYTDATQLFIENDTLKFSGSMSGMAAFTLQDQYDTVNVTGIDSNDVVVVSIREAIPGANDPLGVKVEAGKIIAQRAGSGTSGLKWNWIWIRKY